MRLIRNDQLPIAWVTPNQVQVGADTQNSFLVEDISPLARSVLEEADGVKNFSKIEIAEVEELIQHQILLEINNELNFKNSLANLKIEVSNRLDYQDSFSSVLKIFGFERVARRSSDPRYSKAEFSIVTGFSSFILQQNHLLVNFVGDFISLGPLVVPGESACLNCLYLHRKDVNSLWPAVALSFDHSPKLIHSEQLKIASSFTARILNNFISGYGFDLKNQILEFNMKKLFFQLRDLSHHPKCGCTW